MPNFGKVPVHEQNNFPQGRSGAETKKKPGPAVGAVSNPNPTNSGGINRATSGKKGG
jgi:hypothetical protein